MTFVDAGVLITELARLADETAMSASAESDPQKRAALLGESKGLARAAAEVEKAKVAKMQEPQA